VDVRLAHRRVADKIANAISRVLENGTYVLGPEVEAFESAFADYCDVPYCIGVGNGTDAIELAIRSLRIGRGDQVILPANTFVATVEAVLRSGARPVFADVGPDYLLLPAGAAAAKTSATKAVIGVHLYGQMAPMERIGAIMGSGVATIEDAAQAQGARRHGSRAGSVSDVAASSFYPGKNLGAYGDAGAVMTASPEVAHLVRMIRNHGGVNRYEHLVPGVNSRLDSIQAAVLMTKLEVLDEWNEERRAAAKYYFALLHELARENQVVLPAVANGNEHVWHLFVVGVERRGEVIGALNGAGIAAGIHYPTPAHLLPATRELGCAVGEFPVAESQAKTIMSLPIYPGITPDQQEYVVDALTKALR
jgi:dTDP-4-amino-4,6-dideoxygalactose transaminase